jgi:hypothetical protein
MSDLLNTLKAPLGLLPNMGSWDNPSQVLLVALIFTLIGSYCLLRILSGAKSVTAPICFWVLFACAMAANRFLGGFHVPGANALQQTIIYTTLGTIVGSILLLATLRTAERGEG